jgi:hypothetical protein
MDVNSTKTNIEKVNKINNHCSLTFAKPKLSVKLTDMKNLINNATSELKNINKTNSELKTDKSLRVENIICTEDTNEDFESSLYSQNSNYRNKKRPIKQFSDVEERSTNVQSILKNKVGGKRRKLSHTFENNKDFVELEQQQIKKHDKFNKWGFKKSNKKIINFDLDDMDVDEPKFEDSLHSVVINKKSTNILANSFQIIHCNENKRLLNLNDTNENDADIKMKSFENNNVKLSNENKKKGTFIELSKTKDVFKNSTLVIISHNHINIGKNIIP